MSVTGSNTYSGQTQIQGGTLMANSSVALGDASGTNTISITNGASLLGDGNFDASANRTVALGTGGGNLSATSGNSMTISGVVSGSTALTVGTTTTGGTGTVILTANNANSGTVGVNAGTLLVNNTQVNATDSGTGSGAVTVNSGATMGGNGFIAGDVTVGAGGVLSPGSTGANAGTLTLLADLTMTGSGSPDTRLSFGYSGPTGNGGFAGPGDWATYTGSFLSGTVAGNDLLNLAATSGTHSITWDDGAKISLTAVNAYSWQLGDILNLVDWTNVYGTSIGGTFDPALSTNWDLPSLTGGLSWDTSRFLTTGAIAVVPEPSRVLLLFLGLFGVFFRRRRQSL